MSPKKLTEDDKKQILQLYRNSEATTSTLAEDYGVSSSTISRFLKGNLSEAEYEELIQQKRLARTHKSDHQSTKTKNNDSRKESSTISEEKKTLSEQPSTSISKSVVSASESSSNSQPKEKIKILPKKKEQLSLEEEDIEAVVEIENEVDVVTLGEIIGEDIDDLDEEDEDIEDDYEDDWDAETDEDIAYPHAGTGNTSVQILPLTDASFPKTCYLVIDRASELITRPLEDFADLGTIPEEEIQQTTLPVFDNHRVARRFSHRRERVIKVPDSSMLQKTSSYLQAKGITRLLIDGQVYSLSTQA